MNDLADHFTQVDIARDEPLARVEFTREVTPVKHLGHDTCCVRISARQMSPEDVCVVLRAVARRCPRLSELFLYQVETVHEAFDAAFACVAHGCPWLTKLRLYDCPGVSETALLAYVGTQVETLQLVSCERITDVGVLAILRGCHKLRDVSIATQGRIQETTSEYLRKDFAGQWSFTTYAGM